MSSSGSGNNQCNIQNVQYDLQNKDRATSDKFRRDSDSSADLLENAFSFGVRSSVQAPTPHFQFDVCSEDGIRLFVDLNSSPSSWIESLKDGVHICSNIHKLESPNHHHPEIGRRCCRQKKGSSHVDSLEEVDNVEEVSHPVIVGVSALPELNELNGAEGFLSSPRCNPGNTAHCLGNFGEEEATTSSRPESDIEKQVCGAKFCTREQIISADPNTVVVPQVKTCNNSPGYSLSSFAKCSKMLESQMINANGDIHSLPCIQQKHGPPEPDVVCTGLSASASREIRESSSNAFDHERISVCQDFACQPKSNTTKSCGMINSVTCTKMQAFEVANHSKSASSCGLVNGHSSDPTDVNQDKVETENNKASISGEYDWKLLEAQKHQASNQINGTSPPLRNYESGDVNLRRSIETDYPFLLCSHKADQKAVGIRSSLDDVRRNKALLSSCSNGASPSFVAPEKNDAGHCTPPDTDDLDKDVPKSQSTSMENLSRVLAGDQRKKAERLDFRDPMTNTGRKSSGSESSRDHKRKRQLNGTEGRSQSVKRDANITRITRQFASKIQDSRRRSSRLFTK